MTTDISGKKCHEEESKDEITLNLSIPTDVIHLKGDQIFQREAKRNIFQKIQWQLDYISANDQKSEQVDRLFYERYHNAITICGARGSGKSTLIRHILTNLDDPTDKSTPRGLAVLEVIDPTLISSKEHVLIILISQIQDLVAGHKSRVVDEVYGNYVKALKNLAGGLCQIDGIGSNANYGDEWEDKNYILEKGLSKASEGRKLEKRFNSFIEKALNVLGKNAIVVTFDDIDTQFERGWPVLESVRKYLTSPKLVILISGDIELYSTLVKSAQLESLGSNIMEYDRPSSKYHPDSNLNHFLSDPALRKASDLEEQYLMKVLKPENRVHMLTLQQRRIKRGSSSGVLIKKGEKEKEQTVTLEEYLEKVLKKAFGITRQTEQLPFISAILNLPARTMLQFINATKLLVELDSNGVIEEKLDSEGAREVLKEQFCIRIIDTFASSMTNLSIKATDLQVAQYSLNKLVQLFWDWGLKQSVWQRFDNLLPSSPNEALNNRIITFLTLINRHVQTNPGSALEWMMLVGFPSRLSIDYQQAKHSDASISKILAFLGVGDNYVNLYETINKGLLAQIKIDNRTRPASLGLYRVPIKEVGLKVEQMISKFYSGPELDTYKSKIQEATTAKDKNKLKDLRLSLKKDFHYTLSQNEVLSELSSDNLLGEWFSQISKVYGEHYTQECDLENRVAGIIYNRIDNIREFYELGALVNLALITTGGYIKSQETGFMSATTLITNLVRLLQEPIDNELDLRRCIANFVNQSKLPMPDWAEIGEDELPSEEDEAELEGASKSINEYNGGFYSRLFSWISSVKEKWSDLNISHSSLMRVINNSYEFVKEVNPERGLGSLIHAQIVSIFHALLLEDAYRANKNNLSTKGLVNTERVFFENFKKLYHPDAKRLSELTLPESTGEAPLLQVFLSCPLLGLFLRDNPKKFSGKPDSWSWLGAHAHFYYKFCQHDTSQGTKKTKVDENQAKSEFIEEYLLDLKVSGEVYDVEMEFSNLNTLLNTVPITTGDSYQNMSIELSLKARSEGSDNDLASEAAGDDQGKSTENLEQPVDKGSNANTAS